MIYRVDELTENKINPINEDTGDGSVCWIHIQVASVESRHDASSFR